MISVISLVFLFLLKLRFPTRDSNNNNDSNNVNYNNINTDNIDNKLIKNNDVNYLAKTTI